MTAEDSFRYLYDAILITAGIITAFRFRKLDRAGRYIAYWLWLGLLTEGLGDLSIALIHTNLQVYGLSNFMEFFLVCGYFNESIPRFKKKNTGLILGMTGVLLGILNSLFLQPLNTANSNFLFLSSMSFICLALYALYRMFAEPDVYLIRESHFWLTCMFVFYGCMNLGYWDFYDYIVAVYPKAIILTNNFFIVENTMTYTACGFLLYRYPNMRQTYI